jgi:hypothetical protein
MVSSLFRASSSGCQSVSQFVGLGGDPVALLQEPRVQQLLKKNDMISMQMAVQGLLENCYLGNAQIIGDAVGWDGLCPQRVADGPQRVADGPQRVADGPQRVADGPQRVADGPQRVADGPQRVADSSRRVDIVVSGLPAWSLALVLAEGWDVPIAQFCFFPPPFPAPDLAPPLIFAKPLPFAWMNYAAGRLVQTGADRW